MAHRRDSTEERKQLETTKGEGGEENEYQREEWKQIGAEIDREKNAKHGLKCFPAVVNSECAFEGR